MGVSVESAGKSGRRGVDSEVNLIPMIDLLVVTISFLLLTAVWTSAGRMDATAQTPGAGDESTDVKPRKLVLDARGESFVLTWKEGEQVIRRTEVAKHETTETTGKTRRVRYPELSRALSDEWETYGLHKDAGDRRTDLLVLRTTNELPYASLVGMLDASSAVRRPVGTTRGAAFDVPFAVD